MKKRYLLPGSLLGCMVAVAAPVLAQSTSGFTTFDVQGAGTEAQQGTMPKGIDAAGDVAGSYVDQSGVVHGFIRTANGEFTSFDPLTAGTSKGLGTYVMGLDAGGDVGGYP